DESCGLGLLREPESSFAGPSLQLKVAGAECRNERDRNLNASSVLRDRCNSSSRGNTEEYFGKALPTRAVQLCGEIGGIVFLRSVDAIFAHFIDQSSRGDVEDPSSIFAISAR